MRLIGKVAIITGGAKGIGRAGAILFAQQGAEVIVADCDQRHGEAVVKTICANGGKALFVAADVSNESDVQRMTNIALSQCGHVDILYNNAGILDPCDKDLAAIELTTWNHVLGVNLTSSYLCARYALPSMIQRRCGAIIMTSSIGALQGCSLPHVQDAYTAAKGALLSLTNSMAVEYGPYNVRVNAICPGLIETDLNRHLLQSENSLAMRLACIPLNRAGEPQDIAHAALFLASDEAGFVTGVHLVVDGGGTRKYGYY
jgi:NAD(P)-dependent dehydrogenase (short-subunit alcohol dehydrogenase family)